MRRIRRGFRMELMPTLSLAWPVVVGELGWMAMGIVNTIFVGRLGAEAIGAVSIGIMLYFAVAIFSLGLLLGLDTLVSQAFGAGRRDECHQWLVQGVYLCLILSPMVMGRRWRAPLAGAPGRIQRSLRGRSRSCGCRSGAPCRYSSSRPSAATRKPWGWSSR